MPLKTAEAPEPVPTEASRPGHGPAARASAPPPPEARIATAPSPYVGHFDSFTDGIARGWALNLANMAEPPVVHVLIDRQEVGRAVCEMVREDVRVAFNHPTGKVGFEFKIPEAFFDGEEHRICLRLPDRSVVPTVDPLDPDKREDGFTFASLPPVNLMSFVDGFKRGKLRGWVLNHHLLSGERIGGVLIQVTVDGAKVAQVRADRYRGDVASVLNCDPNCGYEVGLPQRFKGSGQHTIRIYALPDHTELSGSPLVTSLADNALEAQLVDVSRTIEVLYKEITRLRNEVINAMPTPDYDLNDYDRWARIYYRTLRQRVDDARDNSVDPMSRPLVSILVPTYKPLISDFTAAVDSVIAQTYANWELIIIDDGCKSAEVMKVVDDYCARDSRIRSVRLKKNQGIAGATNAGMGVVRGKYTLFFDHDDLLVDVAVEMMVDGAERTGAKLIFSDEDKIDQAGYYLEPNFKPDFNYRYLLGCNYICHITMVDTEVMKKVGHLRTAYDGAQDHDFVLRVSEEIRFDQVHHVREVLYHWRKTPNSTAVRVDNKTYAIDAGIRAVGDHLKRRGVKAKVSSVNGLTLYGVKWELPAKLPRVSIIIPFKDEIETTQRCLDDLLKHTKYANYDIILVNNWSVTREAERFIARARKTRRVSVLDVEEPFNYSRLNNLACAGNDAEFFFFMNNDVFIDQPDWLNILVGEALSADDVGVVGMKLLYPNNTMQHTGVIVGAAGVAAHVHRGLKYDDYGYIGRAALSNEYSAVTAAGMLVRASAYRAVGGFDEVSLQVAYNDVDLCLKIREAGYRVIYCAEVCAFHHESLSRGSDEKPEHEARFFRESQTMQKRWGDRPIFRNDPGYSRFFSVDKLPFFNLVDPETLE
ncbi:GT2 family glycosyltransferase [Endobacter medicaginis]|uniref:Glycosyltransferase n=1 Tax=Endobacter medicaginis TaxID=1181271 RepID=A0A839UUK1_9PROT|nr:glycosyltransferase [Endobacter medicaginis]MBB3172345.1 GT2 family glycosyltransferase [Endobacter medicaginis]MCX5476695.1 glycosyltransferase [Endobacter medicaginis]NVN29764.1 glycosyltransferase [Endobacter medicaginis]